MWTGEADNLSSGLSASLALFSATLTPDESLQRASFPHRALWWIDQKIEKGGVSLPRRPVCLFFTAG